jgi:hypothetical protein
MAPTFTFVARTFTMSLWTGNLFMGFVLDSNESILVPLFHYSNRTLMIYAVCTSVDYWSSQDRQSTSWRED